MLIGENYEFTSSYGLNSDLYMEKSLLISQKNFNNSKYISAFNEPQKVDEP